MQSYPRYELYGESQKLIDWVKALPYVDETKDAEVQSYVDKIKDAYKNIRLLIRPFLRQKSRCRLLMRL